MKIAIISLGCPKNQVDADVFCHAPVSYTHLPYHLQIIIAIEIPCSPAICIRATYKLGLMKISEK